MASKANKSKESYNRRDFLRKAAICAASFLPVLAKPNLLPGRWAFLDSRLSEQVLNASEIERYCVPLDPEQQLGIGLQFEQLRGNIEKMIFDEMARRNFDPNKEYRTIPTDQFYGMPDNEIFTETLVDYSKIALDFLFSKIRGLRKYDWNFTQIKKGDNFENDFHQKIYVGGACYELRKAKVINPDKSKQSFEISEAHLYNGGIHRLEIDSDMNPLWWFIFLCTGPMSLTAPIGEIVHISTTNRNSNEYAKTEGMLKSIQADEAVTEGIAYLLGIQLSKEIGIPDGESRISKMRDIAVSNVQVYQYLPASIRWMQKNGIQQAFDLYMESPQKFMEAIKTS